MESLTLALILCTGKTRIKTVCSTYACTHARTHTHLFCLAIDVKEEESKAEGDQSAAAAPVASAPQKESLSVDQLFDKFDSSGLAPKYCIPNEAYYDEHVVSEDQFAACLKNGRAVLKELKGRKILLNFCLSLPIFNALREHSKTPSKFFTVGVPGGVVDNSELLERCDIHKRPWTHTHTHAHRDYANTTLVHTFCQPKKHQNCFLYRVKQLYVAVQSSLLVLTIPDTLESLTEDHIGQVKDLLCLLLQAAVAAYAVPVTSLTKAARPDNGNPTLFVRVNVCACVRAVKPVNYRCLLSIYTDQQQSEAQSGDKEEEDGEQSSSTAAGDKMDVAEMLQQLQCSKTVEIVCSLQNMVNALHAIIISSVSAQGLSVLVIHSVLLVEGLYLC